MRDVLRLARGWLYHRVEEQADPQWFWLDRWAVQNRADQIREPIQDALRLDIPVDTRLLHV